MAPPMTPRSDDESTFTELVRPPVPRPSIRPEIRPPAFDDDDATLVYSSGMRAASVSRVDARRESTRSRASMFPSPPADRPRVFERPSRDETSARTVLRPSLRAETTELRPASYATNTPRLGAAASTIVRTERPSLRAVTLEVDEPQPVSPIRREPKERMAIAAAAALFAPIVLAFAFLGPGDAVAAQATLITPPVLATAVLAAADVRAPPLEAPTPVSAAPAPAVIDVHPAPAMGTPSAAYAPRTQRAYAQRPAILTPPHPPRLTAAPAQGASKSGIPDAEAASALARAQLEAALR
jgi:hypothetical protein